MRVLLDGVLDGERGTPARIAGVPADWEGRAELAVILRWVTRPGDPGLRPRLGSYTPDWPPAAFDPSTRNAGDVSRQQANEPGAMVGSGCWSAVNA